MYSNLCLSVTFLSELVRNEVDSNDIAMFQASKCSEDHVLLQGTHRQVDM